MDFEVKSVQDILNDPDFGNNRHFSKSFDEMDEDEKKQKEEKLKEARTFDLKIKPLKSRKDDIKQREIMKEGLIMDFPSITIISGRAGSGKTNLLATLLCKPDFFGDRGNGNFFDLVFLFTNSIDDLLMIHCKKLLPKKRIFVHPTPSDFQKIIDIQEKVIEANGFKKAPKLLFILDDVINDTKMLSSKVIKSLFFQQRHLKTSIFILTQDFASVPLKFRKNAHFVIFFKGTKREHERLAEDFGDNKLNKNEMLDLIDFATKEPFNFLFINNKIPDRSLKFRKNFDDIIRF